MKPVVESLAGPSLRPVDLAVFFYEFLPYFADFEELLADRHQQQRGFAPPAVRIIVSDAFLVQQKVPALKQGYYFAVGGFHELACERAGCFVVLAVHVDRRDYVQAVLRPDLVVFLAVARGRMDKPRSGVKRDVLV